jgi:hypothetical protein
LPAGLAGTIQAQIVDEERQKPQQIDESYRFPAVITGPEGPSATLPVLLKNFSRASLLRVTAATGSFSEPVVF